MSDEKHETIADIVADIRAQNQGLPEDSNALSPLVCDLLRLADRIEAAAKREVEDAERRGGQAATKAFEEVIEKIGPLYTAETIPIGNGAKLREAVQAVVDVGYPHNFQKEAPHIRGYCYDITRAIDKCFAALAEPPRNFEVGTAEECRERFVKFCERHYCSKCPFINCKNVHVCMLEWARTPYKKGGSK